jgi:RimJ/RimL family protein N-acetyltransferase
MKLRVLTPSDVDAYRDLRLRALREWPPAFGTPVEEEEQLSLKEFSERLVETENRCLIGAFEEEVLVGSVRLSRYESGNEFHRAYVAGLYVIPERRNLGYGRALFTQAVARARLDGRLRRLNLTVVSEQKSAIALYASLGFVSYGIEKEVFQARGLFFDEILMTLDLKTEPNQPVQRTGASARR